MNATADLLSLAIVGYLFLYIFNYTRFYISQKSGYETLFLSIVSGCINDKKGMDKIKAKVENEVREEFEKLERTISSSDIEENYKKKALDRLRKEKREKETKRIDDEKRISIKRGLPRIIVPLAGIVTVKLAAWQ